MKSEPVLLILSSNRDFIEPLGSLVTRELKLSCITIASEEEIKGYGAGVVICEKKPLNSHLPVILVNLPIKIRSLFADIEDLTSKQENMDVIDITQDIQLSLLHKTITHKSKGEAATLTDKECQVLQIIAASGQAGVSRETLLKEVWRMDAALDTHTLETHIYRLRKKIKDAFGDEMIRAVDGGYRI